MLRLKAVRLTAAWVLIFSLLEFLESGPKYNLASAQLQEVDDHLASGEAVLAVISPQDLEAAASADESRLLPHVTAQAAAVMEWSTGKLLFEKNATWRMAPASTTKIMTAIVALEWAESHGGLEQLVSVSPQAAYTPGSSAGLRPGDVYSLRDLLYGLMLESGNDAAEAVAEHVAGSVSEFVKLMNDKAWEIGAWETKFANPHGLTAPGHYSTAADLAIMARYAFRNPEFVRIVSTTSWVATERKQGKKVTFYNHNKLLSRYEPAEGVKTGTTSAAGQCLVGAATKGSMRLISVVLKSRRRWDDSIKLMEYGFSNYVLMNYANKGEPVFLATVVGGVQKKAMLQAGDNLSVVVPKADLSRVALKFNVLPLLAPLWSTQVAGYMTASLEGEDLASIPLVPHRNVRRLSWFSKLFNLILAPVWD